MDVILKSIYVVPRLIDICANLLSNDSYLFNEHLLESVLRIVEVSMSFETDSVVLNENIASLVGCVGACQKLEHSMCFMELISRLIQNPSRERKKVIVDCLIKKGITRIILKQLQLTIQECHAKKDTTQKDSIKQLERAIVNAFTISHDLVDTGDYLSEDESELLLFSLKCR